MLSQRRQQALISVSCHLQCRRRISGITICVVVVARWWAAGRTTQSLDRLFCFSAKFVYVTVDNPWEECCLIRTSAVILVASSPGAAYVSSAMELSRCLASSGLLYELRILIQ